jgi:hypothetical protein
MKTAIIIIADASANTDDTNGRAFNALTLGLESKQQGDDVAVVFIGAGTRWPAVLRNPTHPFHGLYNEVRDVIKGASCGCAAAFGATEGVQACGIPELKEFALPTTPGLASIRPYLADGYHTIVF